MNIYESNLGNSLQPEIIKKMNRKLHLGFILKLKLVTYIVCHSNTAFQNDKIVTSH
jgi:hypothetical protein